MAVRSEVRQEQRAEHVACFFADVDGLTGAVVDFLAEALHTGAVGVVLATAAHRRAFETGLAAAGVDVARAAADGYWVTGDAAELAEELLCDGRIDPAHFDARVGTAIRRAASSGRPVAVYGEVVALLWEAGELAAAIEMERLGNRLLDEVPVSLLCAYPATPWRDDAEVEAFESVCRLHSRITASERTSADLREHRDFPRAPDAPTGARRFVVDVLRRSGRAALCDDGALVVTELASNSVRHACSRFSVTVSSHGGTVRIAVADTSAAAPAPRPPRQLDTSGRGLTLVAGLARRWGATMAHDGKVVWAELQL